MTDNEKTLYERLEQEMQEADWNMLEPHATRQALVLVSSDLDLIHVGEKVATDEVDAIKQWMEEGKVTKPSDEQIKKWKESPYKKGFEFLIIQPYVLAQEKEKLKQ